ncbi:KIR protein [Plasmodium coatneyi]|uniref:KIR protein n=1 Tax=Plasmodium coatneyi TaxID=208452 RepID=A0A1B1DXB3_9APIC|nr:KIR protein [Plasmodium coatneyi]ANQ07436.1 KIR protein [Plasmodium coatneyi]
MDLALGNYPSVSSYAVKIAKAQCCASHLGGKDSADNEYCHYLYFWTGELLSGKLKDPDFKKAMEEIYKEMENYDSRFNCKNLCPNVNKDEFDKRKVAYEYLQNYATIHQKLTENNKFCDSICSDYLMSTYKTYSEVYEKCVPLTSNSEAYCTTFLKEHAQHQDGDQQKLQKLQELKCSTKHTGDDAIVGRHAVTHLPEIVTARQETLSTVQEQSQSHTAMAPTSTTPAIAVSSAMVTIGLPTLAYFLYKAQQL